MAESIRSLVVKLGYDVDTTGAKIFKDSFKDLEKALNRSTNISGFARTFNKKFTEAGKSIKSNIKKVMLGVGAVVAAATAGAIKVFKGFANIETAQGALEFRASKFGPEKFKEVLASIQKTRKETKSLVSELDALNTINIGADIIGDLDFLTSIFGDVIKLSKILGKDIDETQRAFANFVRTGTNLQDLVAYDIFSPEQIKALEDASTTLGKQGLEARKTQLIKALGDIRPRTEEGFAKVLTRNQTTLDQLSTSAEDATIAIGKKLSPSINNVAKNLKGFSDRLKESVEAGDNFKDLMYNIAAPGSPLRNTFERFGYTKSTTTKNTSTDNSVTNINVKVEGGGDVEKKFGEKLAQESVKIRDLNKKRKTPQSLNTTIQTSPVQ